MNNLSSYYGLTDSRMSASDTDLTVLSAPPLDLKTFLRPCVYYYDVVVLLWGKKMG